MVIIEYKKFSPIYIRLKIGNSAKVFSGFYDRIKKKYIKILSEEQLANIVKCNYNYEAKYYISHSLFERTLLEHLTNGKAPFHVLTFEWNGNN